MLPGADLSVITVPAEILIKFRSRRDHSGFRQASRNGIGTVPGNYIDLHIPGIQAHPAALGIV